MGIIGFAYWSLSICIAWLQGGFWWITLNIFLPIAPAFEIAKIILKNSL